MSRDALLWLAFASFWAAVLLPSHSRAQGFGSRGPGSPEERIEERVLALTCCLSLSETQAEGVRSILEEHYGLLKEDRETYGDDRETMIEILRGRMKRLDAKIMDLLTAEQRAEYEKYKEERRQEMRSRGQRSGEM